MVRIGSGELKGESLDGGLTAFRGVPFARAPRFGPPGPAEPWTGVRDATRHGPAAPQPPPRVGAVMGELKRDLVQDEDCLNLSVVTPGTEGRRPVMVWIHGGAYTTGAGSMDIYDARRLAAEGDVVVVTINYRLGALGYLRLDGISPGNLGLLDQLAGLRWVHENVAAFGGDPDQVTVFGQSAGAHSIACLMALPEARGLFRRAILQSAPLGLGLASPATATRIARYFTSALGEDPRTAPVERILAAQQAAIVRAAGPGGLYSAPPFCPTGGTAPLPPAREWLPRAARAGVDVVIGTTRSEMNAFLNGKPGIAPLERTPVIRRGLEAAKSGITRYVFGAPAMRFAGALGAAGARVFTYRFDWAAEGTDFGACHCIELPFLFGDEQAWSGAPMLGTSAWDARDRLGRELRRAWISFARTGTPAFSRPWQPDSLLRIGPDLVVSPAAAR
ncbi:carboxylesterase family protein [Amycolatopsis sp. K13G38]|uniref:Carboxylic ester hydrolase n=1 Tax=Amycolatopsis acididurans TaxID=2724524 RepID=A0ABX1J397_9PSEU|nr:carboxylesterase family protein [Amycolatopsis acididurans]NKQ52756.1 carboxylesterase family protein [Amycolatopsis acididurans]